MDTKLTLKLKQDIIEKAKDYARLRKTSLSKLIESYLHKITNDNDASEKITPLVKSLSGIIDLPESPDHKKSGYADYLTDKYKQVEKVFVDTDIILDLLSNREPFYFHSAKLFSAADKNEIGLHVSSLAFANLNYILSKQYSTDQAKKKLLKFKTLVTVLAVTDKIIELALASDFKDFEDAVQYFTAIENNIKVLLTRNLKDYKSSEIPVMTAEQFLKARR